MAKRPNSGHKEQLTTLELKELSDKLSAMKQFEVEIYYKATHNACRYDINGRVPCPRAIQELVQAWKALRRVR